MNDIIKEVFIKYGFMVDEKSKKSTDSSIETLLDRLHKIVQTLISMQMIWQLMNLSDKFNQLNNEIAFVTRNLDDAAEAQEIIADSAEDTRTSYDSMIDTVKVLINSNSALFQSTKEAADYAELMTKAFKGTGMESEKAASMAQTLAKSFITGKVSAGAISQMMTEAPQILEYLADEMGITTQAVKAIGMQGQITARQMYEALKNHTGEIEDMFGNLKVTAKETMQVVKTELQRAIVDLNNELKFTETIAGMTARIISTIAGFLNRLTERVKELKSAVGDVSDIITPLLGALSGMGTSSLLVGFISPEFSVLLAVVSMVVKKVIELIRKDDELKSKFGETFKTLGDLLTGVLKPILRIVDAVSTLLAMPIVQALKPLLNLLNAAIKLLEPVLWLVEKIVDVIAIAIQGLASLISGEEFDIIQQVNETLDINKDTKRAQDALVSHSNSRTTTINNSFVNTFNGTDREVQKAQAKTASNNADAIIRTTTTALAYGG